MWGTAFINKNIGWSWNIDGSDGGAFSTKIDIKKTTNGGSTWMTLISNMETVTPAGLSFINEKVGWMTGNTPAEGTISLLETRDGGVHWKIINLNIPIEFIRELFMTSPPAFFSKEDGLLLVRGLDNPKRHLFFITHDSGKHWIPIINKLIGTSKDLNWDFTDPNNLRVSYQKKKWKTTDYGFTWKEDK